MSQPKVSVVLSFYNNDQYLRQSVDSILHQSFSDFEFIILNDGSTDRSVSIMNEYNDPRIIVVHNEHNIGLAASLNRGLQRAKGEYIARMDADDIALPNRLEKQVEYLDTHQQVGLLGTQRFFIDVDGKPVNKDWPLPTTDLQIRWMLMFSNPFAHPTVMFRRELITKHNLFYDESYLTTQDYELWSRMLLHTKAANLNDKLIYYRLGQGIKQTRRDMQIENTIKVIQHNMQNYLQRTDICNSEIKNILALLFLGSELGDKVSSQHAAIIKHYLDIFGSFKEKHSMLYESDEIRELAREVMNEVCFQLLRPPLKLHHILYTVSLILRYPTLIISIIKKLVVYGINKFKRNGMNVCAAY